MSEASEEMKAETEGEVPTAQQVATATAQEVADSVGHRREQLERAIASDPLRAVGVAAVAGFLFAILARRL
jgi:ElaB/YqjD/DUF883 family membrane-anchored ribosome-binding protein